MTKSQQPWRFILLSLFLVLVLPALSRADTVYQLTGTLSGSADPMSLNGDSFAMTLVAQTFLESFTDPNGTQFVYQATGTLMIGGSAIPISSASAYFFHSASGLGDVANFFLYPVSGAADLYYPAVNLPPDANASAGSGPPVYFPDIPQNANLLVQENGVDYAFQITSESFSSAPVPEPGTLSLIAGGLAVVALRRSRKQKVAKVGPGT